MADERPFVRRFDWERAVRDSGLPSTTKLVLLTFATYVARETSVARPGVATLMHATGLKDSTVRKHLDVAIKAGYLEQTSRGHRRLDGSKVTSEFKLTVPATATCVAVAQPPRGVPHNRHVEYPATATPVAPISKSEQKDEQNNNARGNGAARCAECWGQACVVVDQDIVAGKDIANRDAYRAGVYKKKHEAHEQFLIAESIESCPGCGGSGIKTVTDDDGNFERYVLDSEGRPVLCDHLEAVLA